MNRIQISLFITVQASEGDGMRRDKADEILRKVVSAPHEDEVIEFKDRRTLNKDEMGVYFSALSNEAELGDHHSAWMIFGISDDGEVMGTNFLDTVESQSRLKRYIYEQCGTNLSYRDIHTMNHDGKRVLMFEIPAAQHGTPTSFKGIAYERQGESVYPLTEEKRRRIMNKSLPDWSSQIVPGVGMDVLDPIAVMTARRLYRSKHPDNADASDAWSDQEFLNRMGLTIDGAVTYTAIVLLGKEESSLLIPDSSLCLRWILRDDDDMTLSGEVFGTPFILSIERLYSRIRNLEYSDFRTKTLAKVSTDTYDPNAVRELICNAIAHQDYLMREMVTVVEYDRDRLVFINAGDFMPGSIDRVILGEGPSYRYRNEHMVRVMNRIGMVETIGTGIQRVFRSQIERMFPLPEYDLSEEHVRVTLYGRVIDREYREILMRNPNLKFRDILCLDRISKGEDVGGLDASGLVSAGLVHTTASGYALGPGTPRGGASVESTPGKRVSNSDCRTAILEYLEANGTASRGEIDALLFDLLPEGMSEERKKVKVSNVLQSMRKEGLIGIEGTTRNPIYHIPGK